MPFANCDYCGKEYTKAGAKLKQVKYHFCSRQCYKEFRKKNKYYTSGKRTEHLEILLEIGGGK